MLAFAIRQLVVYILIFALSLFVGRTSGPDVYATFTLFNFFFGLTYILADLGYGKAVIRSGLVAGPPHFGMASILNLVFGCLMGAIAFSFFLMQKRSMEAVVIFLCFICASSAFAWFFKSESSADFTALGKAEIIQVVVYVAVFFLMYFFSRSAATSLFAAAIFRCLSIPTSYYIFSRNRLSVRGMEFAGFRKTFQLLYNGFFYQVSLILFAIKDLVLAYMVFWYEPNDIKGLGFMAHTYMMLPLMIVNPISRFLLPKLARGGGETDVASIKRLVTIMLVYALFSTLLLFILFPIFNNVMLAGKFYASQQFLIYFACANVISIPALSVASFLAVNRGYKVYLYYALLCTGVTWLVGACGVYFPGDSYGYPSAVLAGHIINLGLLAWFFLHKPEVKQNYAKNI